MILDLINNFLRIAALIIVSFQNITYAETSTKDTNIQKHSELKELYKNGAFNFRLFNALATTSNNPHERLAYARQAMVLSPQDKEIRKILETTKQELSTDKSPSTLDQKKSMLDLLAIKSYFPFYVEDYLLITISAALILMTLFNIKWRIGFLLNIFIFIILSVNKLGVTYTRDGSLRFINSYSDIFKHEAIALKEFKTYSSQNLDSQITIVVKPGNELDVLNSDPNIGDWIKVRFDNNRFGWIKYDPADLYIIVR